MPVKGGRVATFAGLTILGLYIGIRGDWSSALVYALLVAVVLFVAWLVNRWRWFENKRAEAAISRTMLEAEERRAASGANPHLSRGDAGGGQGTGVGAGAAGIGGGAGGV